MRVMTGSGVSIRASLINPVTDVGILVTSPQQLLGLVGDAGGVVVWGLGWVGVVVVVLWCGCWVVASWR